MLQPDFASDLSQQTGKTFFFSEEKWRAYFFLTFSFLLPVWPDLATRFLFIWLLFSLVVFSIRRCVAHWQHLWPLFLFVLYVLSWALSQHGDWHFLERKASLLIFPVLFLLHGRVDIRLFTRICHAFVWGVLLSLVICECVAVYAYAYHWWQPGLRLTGFKFSIIHQSVYFSVYMLTAVLILIRFPLKSAISTGLLIIFLLIGIFQVANKATILTGVVLLLLFLFFRLKGKWRFPVVTGAFGIMCLAMILWLPRWKDTIQHIRSHGLEVSADSYSSDELRIISWMTAAKLVSQHWLTGLGLGDTQMVMNREYEAAGYVIAAKKKLNAHNTYLALWLENGIAGLVWVLLFLYFLFRRAKEHHLLENFILSFILMIGINFLFESFFSRFSGLAFLSFFFGLLMAVTYPPGKVEEQIIESSNS